MTANSSSFSRSPNQALGMNSQSQFNEKTPIKKTLLDVIRGLDGAANETVDRSKTIFFPGDPAERVYLIRRGAVRLTRVYESGEEITVALLRENSLFGVLSLLTGHRSDRFYHAVAFTKVEMTSAPAGSVRNALEGDSGVGLLLLQGLSSRILPCSDPQCMQMVLFLLEHSFSMSLMMVLNSREPTPCLMMISFTLSR